MEQKTYLALTAMLNAFPQGSSNPDLTMRTFEAALADCEDEAIVKAASRYTTGDVPEQSLKFAPTIPEFVQQVRKCQEFIDLASRPRLPPPKYVPGKLAPFQVAQQKALAENSNRPVLFEDVNFEQFKRMSAEKQIPVGAKWVAALGIVYGPEPKQQSEAA
jgi:hypothetical protein